MDHLAFDKIERNKLRLILTSQPFFGCLLGYLKLIEVPEGELYHGHKVNTMCTNGKVLAYSAKFVMSLPDKELQFVLVHEVLHNAFEHHIRRRERNPKKWNIATDYVINLVVSKIPNMEMPKIGLINPAYEGMDAEEVYSLLPPGEDGDDGEDPGGCGGTFDGASPHDQVALDELSAENKIRIAGAAAMARGRMQGNLPAELQRLIDELMEPKVDWAAQFRNLVTSLTRPDYSFSKPNKRFMHQGLYLPGYVPNAVGHIVVAIDTSGSINDEILNAFASEVKGMFDEAIIDKITLIWADAAVQHTQVFENGDELVFEPKGGGGTAFSDTFRWIEENTEDVAMTIYLTDLYVSDFGAEPDHPVVWAVYGTRGEFDRLAPTAPFGDCIHVDPA